ncbi:hypothetical protein SNEBB_008031 [Seison nebaliae]|nr:hypothetical protein SNEBB_008031 [Seison nebaliae]
MINDAHVSVKKTVKRVRRAKRKCRSDLSRSSDWRKYSLIDNIDRWRSLKKRENIDRIDANEMNVDEFIREYEIPYQPCIIQNEMKHWDASYKWTPERLLKKYRNQLFKVGEDDEEYSVKLKMKYFMTYLNNNIDDSPLYIFDGAFGEHRKKKQLLDDYNLPKYFNEDLFQYVGEKRRPPYRWFCMGPAMSGTGIHVDPLGTSAWNALLHGHKWWCLFPPHTPKDLLKVTKNDNFGSQKDEGCVWFKVIYPRTKEESWPKNFRPIECIQKPGEMIFVPGGWWHVVLNLDMTIAVTQNFCSTRNFAYVWKKTIKGRPAMAKKWFSILHKERPDLAAYAVELLEGRNRSNFVDQISDDSSSSSSSSDDSSSFESSDEEGSGDNLGDTESFRADKNSNQQIKSPTLPQSLPAMNHLKEDRKIHSKTKLTYVN